MSKTENGFIGRWLHHGDWHGKDFSHEFSEYDHDESPGANGSTRMRHVQIDQNGKPVAVWIPGDWTDDQARTALANNW